MLYILQLLLILIWIMFSLGSGEAVFVLFYLSSAIHYLFPHFSFSSSILALKKFGLYLPPFLALSCSHSFTRNDVPTTHVRSLFTSFQNFFFLDHLFNVIVYLLLHRDFKSSILHLIFYLCSLYYFTFLLSFIQSYLF